VAKHAGRRREGRVLRAHQGARRDNGDEARLRATIAQLRKTIASKNKELAQLRADVPALVRAVNQLTLELQQARDETAALGNVTRLDSRRGPARHKDNQ
jgi:chromosome segregation ATPase